jgi:hypothetical protein
MYKHPNRSLTAGIRVFLMLNFRAAADGGRGRAGHGSFREMTRRACAVEVALYRKIAGHLEAGAATFVVGPVCVDHSPSEA